MSFNESLVKDALYAGFATKTVGQTLQFPDSDPVFSNGADVASAPSIANVTGIPIATYELRQRYLYMKYAFTVETLALAGIADDVVFQDKVRSYFQNEYQTYITNLVVPGTVYKSAGLDDVTFEFNTISSGTVKVARAYTLVKYWFKLA